MNGFTSNHTVHQELLNGTSHSHIDGFQTSPDNDAPYDLICIGFGPASLAIAIALQEHPAQSGQQERQRPIRALFLEQQSHFAWHSGMLLPETHMQISFIKDLATLRNPRSEFTFLNYLHTQGRLVAFTNLGTFLPLREEFNDYLAWCAKKFEHLVKYREEVIAVTPVYGGDGGGARQTNGASGRGRVQGWNVASRHTATNTTSMFTAHNIIVAIGGRPSLPAFISPKSPARHRILHSSQYASSLPRVLPDASEHYNIAVVGSGQSAAEIFNDLHARYPNSTTALFIRSHALKPSDDSPFVNEIFNPEKVAGFYALEDEVRRKALLEDKGTNYSVVRLDLLEKLYSKMYYQRLQHGNDERAWRHRIFPLKEVVGIECDDQNGRKMNLRLRDTRTGKEVRSDRNGFDAVIFGTGYIRDVHERMLEPVRHVMKNGICKAGRDYGVKMEEGKVENGVGVYLQGCCEGTHGLSDTLLSIMAVRSGELIDTIFGNNDEIGASPGPRNTKKSKMKTAAGIHDTHLDGITVSDEVNGAISVQA